MKNIKKLFLVVIMIVSVVPFFTKAQSRNYKQPMTSIDAKGTVKREGVIIGQVTKDNIINDAKGNKIEHSTLSKQVQSDVKRVIKNFAIYEVYKVMNPRRIAGETAKDNFAHNMAYRGEKKAMQYEGGKEEAMKEYGSDEVAKIKKQVSSLGKSKGLER